MREVRPGDYMSMPKDREVFKYIVSSKQQYTLISLPSYYDGCKGCAFSYDSSHPLALRPCGRNGLNCEHRIFKPVDSLLEDL